MWGKVGHGVGGRAGHVFGLLETFQGVQALPYAGVASANVGLAAFRAGHVYRLRDRRISKQLMWLFWTWRFGSNLKEHCFAILPGPAQMGSTWKANVGIC